MQPLKSNRNKEKIHKHTSCYRPQYSIFKGVKYKLKKTQEQARIDTLNYQQGLTTI